MDKIKMKAMPKLILSEEDYGRVCSYLQKRPWGITPWALEEEIDRAEVRRAEDLPPNIVRLGSKVSFLDLSSGLTREITIVQPELANVEKGLISFLAPVGAALLGLSVGQQIDWKMPDGRVRSFKALAVESPQKPSAFSRAA
jgi:regulator of nucleoside diphosphate kinase